LQKDDELRTHCITKILNDSQCACQFMVAVGYGPGIGGKGFQKLSSINSLDGKRKSIDTPQQLE
jgi:hypothetical protein